MGLGGGLGVSYMIRCTARITRRFKGLRTRARSIWPEISSGPNPNAKGLPECGGSIHVDIGVSESSCYCGHGDGPEIDITFICDTCNMAYFPGRLEFNGYNTTMKLTELVNRALSI